MASRLDDLIREHAERLDQLAGPIDLADVTRGPRHGTVTVTLIDSRTRSDATRGRSPLADHRRRRRAGGDRRRRPHVRDRRR